MRIGLWLVATMVLGLGLGPAGAGEEGGGIRWEADVPAALTRAAAEGRPILVAVNALEGEAANEALAGTLYRSAAWAEATSSYVCLVGNPNTHASGASCSRFGGIPCAAHRQTLDWILRDLVTRGELVSPQHLILDPDGRLAFRKEYYTRVVGPELLVRWLVRLCPARALEVASAQRVERIDALDRAPAEGRTAAARAWLESDDVLAAPGVLVAADFARDDEARVTLVRAFRWTPREAWSIPALAAQEAALAPDDRPVVTAAWVDTWLELERSQGVSLLARAAVRTQDDALRERLLSRWFGRALDPRSPPPRDLPAAEIPLAAEVFALLGRPDGVERLAKLPEQQRDRLLRARGGSSGPQSVAPLADVLAADPPPGALRRALLAASVDEVRAQAARVGSLLGEGSRGLDRVGVAAAIALLGARDDGVGRVVPRVLEAIFDPLEGPEARAEAGRRLGEDWGWNAEAWQAALERHVAGGGR